MNGASHLVGGITSAVLLGYHRPSELVVVAVASLLPDIDRQNSLIGRFIPILPRVLESTVGKRTITHSMFTCGMVTLLMKLLLPHFTALFLIGFISHVLLDLPTGRVALLWPFPKTFGISFGIPPVFVETAAMAFWGVWMALGGYKQFVTIFQGGFLI